MKLNEDEAMGKMPHAQIAHFGIFVKDFPMMLKFYCDLFGFEVSDWGGNEAEDRQGAFLTADPNMHHQLVISSGRPEDDDFSTIQQLSFRTETLDGVRQYWRAVEAHPAVERMYTTTHGNAWSVYFWDPEGTRVEVYTDTPWHNAQPCGEPLDLSLSDEEIYAYTEEIVRKSGDIVMFPDWRREMAAKMGMEDWPIRET